ncbi:MAG: O-antigen ligase family protein [Acidobacteria bacterium]|nr:O-antigen ligase family protein [Acidobacteriota bacterium]MCI0723465.1 O-antigen ligase family protein [Acidobacteriota bacterium]
MLPDTCNRIVLSATLFLIVFSPLAYGGVDGWVVSLVRWVIGTMLLAWLARAASLREFKFHWPPFGTPAVLFFLLLVLQQLPMPFSWRAILSPEPLRHSILLPASPDFAVKATSSYWTQLTLHPAGTLQGTLDLLMCFTLCLILVNSLSSREEIQWAVVALMAVGGFEAVYGLIEFWSGRQGIFWFTKVHYREDVTGTYINHNHFAGLMAMLVPLTTGFLWLQTLKLEASGRNRSLRWRVALLVGVLTAMLLALVLSHSRGGLLSCAGALTWLLWMIWRKHVQHPGRRKRLAVSVTVLVGLISLVLGREISSRFSFALRDAPERIGLWQDGLKIVPDFLWFGTGMGTFKYVFPNYRTQLDFLNVDGVPRQALWNFAHNDYLQLLIECGIIGFGLAVWGMSLTVGQFRQWQRSNGNAERHLLALSAFAGVLAILIHSLVDFNLHIPANALIFCTLASLALVCSRPAAETAEQSDTPEANSEVSSKEQTGE